ncbi:14-3-3-like protein, partial [Zea mays]
HKRVASAPQDPLRHRNRVTARAAGDPDPPTRPSPARSHVAVGADAGGERVHGQACGAGGAVRGDGRVHGARRALRRGRRRRGRALGGGAQPAVRRLQERHRRPQGLVADHLLHRAEGGRPRERGARRIHPRLPLQDRGRACPHLRRHPRAPRLPPRPIRRCVCAEAACHCHCRCF